MRVAIAGAGDLAKYMVEEFLAAGLEVVVISRSEKDWFKQRVSTRISDYSVPSLVEQLKDIDALVSTVLDYGMSSATAHLAMLEACKQSATCKRYIPSEYGGNLDDYPGEPAFYVDNHVPVRKALAEQNDVMWTLVNPGWLMDYFIPAKQRYIKDIGIFHPLDLVSRTLAIPGTGKERLSLTAARDVAKAMAALITKDDWEPNTYIRGQTTTWIEVAKILARHGTYVKKSYRPVALLEEEIAAAENEDAVIAAQYDAWSSSGAGELPEDKIARHSEKFYSGVHVRNIDEFLNDSEKAAEGVSV